MTVRPLIVAAALGLAGLAPLSAAAQSVDFGPERSLSDGGSITVSLTVPAGDTGDQTLSIDYAGNLTSPSFFFVDVTVEGTSIGRLTTVDICETASSTSLSVPDSVYTAAAADGTVEVVFQATPEVFSLCSSPFNYPPPFTAFNDGTPSSFAVQGSLTTSPAPTQPEPEPDPTTDAEAQQATIAATRGQLILQSGPERAYRIDRLRGERPATRAVNFQGIPLIQSAPVGLDVSQNALAFDGDMAIGGLTFWAEGTVIGIDDAVSDDQRFGILHAGIDGRIGDRMLLGLGLQLDRLALTDTDSGDAFEGTGWMIGPLLTYRLDDRLFLDARAAYGEVSTDIDRAGGGSDSYTSDRTLVQLGLTGDLSRGGFVIAPHGELGWYRESSGAYTSTTLGPVSGTEVTVRQAVLGAAVSRPFAQWGGELSPFLDLSAAYADISGDTLLSGSYAEAIEGWSGQVSLGAAFAARNGITWSVEAGLGGLGTDTDTVSGSVALNIPF